MSTPDQKPAAAPIPGPAAAPAADPSPAPPAPAPASDAPLDGDPYGFTAEERTAYDAQKGDTSKKAPAADPGAAPAAPGAPEAAVTAAGAPAAPGADDDDTDDTDLEPDPSKPPPRRIAYHKFKRMADRAKAAEKDLSDFRVKSAGDMAKVEERISLINQALQTPAEKQQQQAEDPEPDPEVDIFAHNKWLARQLVTANKRWEEHNAKIADQETQRTETETIATTYKADAERFATTHEVASQPVSFQRPDGTAGQVNNFTLAYMYLINQRMAEMAATGTADRNEQMRKVALEERGLVARAIKEGASPSERIWGMALARGFAPGKTLPQGFTVAGAAPAAAAAPAVDPKSLAAPGAAAPKTNGAAAPAAAPSVSAEITAIKNGQAAALSLSAAGGVPTTTLTPQALADMDTIEFAEVLARLPKSRQRELLGN